MAADEEETEEDLLDERRGIFGLIISLPARLRLLFDRGRLRKAAGRRKIADCEDGGWRSQWLTTITSCVKK